MIPLLLAAIGTYLIADSQRIETFADGGEVKLLAPNGKPSNLTPEQYKLVRTKVFKKWFGDWENDAANASKVVDENGEPKVVYHGTPQSKIFNEFYIKEGGNSKSKMQLLFGSHFASSKEDAIIYTKGKGFIYEVFLNIREILDLSEHYEKGNPALNKIIDIIHELKIDKKFKNSLDYQFFTDEGNFGGISKDIQRVFLTQYMLDSYPPKKVFDILKNKFDGIVYMPYQPHGFNTVSLFSKSYIAFESNQIKLADGSNTTFEGSNPDIRFAKGGRTIAQTPAPKKDQIYGSKVNAKGSASSEKSASKIILSKSITDTLQNKLSEFKEKNPNKQNISLSDLKAVYRRGLGAYSSSHRPTISGGKPNTRNAWAMARVNKFLLKASGVKVKAAYVQDDDLMK